MKHGQSNLCVFADPSTADQEQCPTEGPKTTPPPNQANQTRESERNSSQTPPNQANQANQTREKFVGDGEGRRTGVIVGTVVACIAVVALIVIITILVSQFLPA